MCTGTDTEEVPAVPEQTVVSPVGCGSTDW